MEDREQKVTFDKNATLNYFLRYLLNDVLFVKPSPAIYMLWGKTNMTNFMDNTLDMFFTDGNSMSIVCHQEAEWIQDLKTIPKFLMEEIDELKEKKVFENHDIFLISNFFTTKECTSLIECSESTGFSSIDYDKTYRSNDRMMTQSKELTHMVYNRISKSKLIPKIIIQENTQWELTGINPQFRFCRYIPSQHFSKHLDGRFIKSENEKSFFTLNIYLNENYENGSTRFYLDETDTSLISLSIKPHTGLAVVFNHETKSYLHDGEVVTLGKKYLLRTDIMYKKIVFVNII
jgi:hypothetical protein